MSVIKKWKQQVKDRAESIYELSKKDVRVDISPKGIQTKEKRPTKQRIKWQAKNH
ncbi:MAG TPA: hypothetical protein H9829_02020 [Candidatus Tetragenococcus pullicola]|nr:hypothetical protein [Candidatus Tetragenococcus pullicola]